MECLHAMRTVSQWRHTRVILAPMWFPSGNLQRLRQSERETEAGTHVELPELRTRHDRNLNAAINRRNLSARSPWPEWAGSGRRSNAVGFMAGEPGGRPFAHPRMDGALTLERRWRAARVESTPEPEGQSPDHARTADAAMP